MIIKKINISGFRGLLAKFSLNLNGNSAVIYGRNGTGKSSITDAWEWFHKGDISHLKREGASYDAYPHREASKENTFVEVFFDDGIIDEYIKVEFNNSRKTKPKISGNIKELRNLSPFPCHIRHQDLTQFVYYTKADKYDSLAKLMGFEKQVEFQKSLRKIERKLSEDLEESNKSLNKKRSKLLNHLNSSEFDKKIVIKKINNILKEWNIELIQEISEIKELIRIFRKKIEKDPNAERLKDYQSIKKMLEAIIIDENIYNDLKIFKNDIIKFLDKEIKISRIMLISIFEKGLKIIEEMKEQKENVNICPMCGQEYPDSLESHINSELNQLTELKDLYNDLEDKRKKLISQLPKSEEILKIIDTNNEVISDLENELKIKTIVKIIEKIIAITDEYKEILKRDTKDITVNKINNINPTNNSLKEELISFKKTKLKFLSRLENKVNILKMDEKHTQLFNDYEWIKDLNEYLSDYLDIKNANKKLEKIMKSYTDIVRNYVEENTKNVENRFEEISLNVAKFYNIIEKRTEGISNPSIKLVPDQYRAVFLEVNFFGERTSPAYKYLSESQLNSFGLAIFLASAKKFNSKFKFLILDDIVNSFDAYKRPRIIELIKSEFSDFQLIIMTHDSIWYKQLTENLPSWKKWRFNRFVFGSGPVTEKGQSELEQIRELLENDKPTNAGQILGPLMERQLQFILERFEVQVTYNRDNIFTLRPLLQFFRLRIKDKLNKNHVLYKKTYELESSTYFRNFCSHWKDPTSSITSEEVLDVLDNWEDILNIIKCSCGNYLKYNGKTFSCQCGETKLERA